MKKWLKDEVLVQVVNMESSQQLVVQNSAAHQRDKYKITSGALCFLPKNHESHEEDFSGEYNTVTVIAFKFETYG